MLLLVRLFCTKAKPPGNFGSTRGPFRHFFGKYLFVTNTLTCGVMMAIGDIAQQKIEKYGTMHKLSGFDAPRTGRMFAVGLAQGLPQHVFYTMLDRFIPGRQLRTIAVKIVLDQLIASPMCIAIFFLGLGALEGSDLIKEMSELRHKFWTVYMVDNMIWPAAQLINFKYIRRKYRVLFVSVISAINDGFLSYAHYDMSED